MEPYERLSRVYDLGWGHFAPRYARLVGRQVGALGLAHGDVLDLGCGTGILAIRLALLGHRVTGVDVSAQMIAAARSAAGPLAGVRFVVADMRRPALDLRFDVAVCGFDAINYLARPADLILFFRAVAGCLRCPGRLVFDSTTERLYLNYRHAPEQRALGDLRFRQSLTYSRASQLAVTRFEFDDGGTEEHLQRAYGIGDLEPAMARAGLRVLEVWQDFDGTPAGPNAERLFVVAGPGGPGDQS